ncbi:hypothetical protein [Streptomyces mexicanus]|jgi:hypothetical protein|uniref:hypothetical protein n=1 Tax=Streptomyces mexicanus TaxID=178566 RepID=UPI0031F10B62
MSAHCNAVGWGSQSGTLTCTLYVDGIMTNDTSKQFKGSGSTASWVFCPRPGRWELQALGPAGTSDVAYKTI